MSRTTALPLSEAGTESKTSAGLADLYRPGKFAVTLLALYIFLLVSRVLDVSPIWWMRIPMILLVLLIVITLARGRFQIAFRSAVTRVFAGFTLWLVVCFPFSEWRAASIGSIESQFKAFALFVIVVQLLKTPQDWRRAAGALAYAVLTASVLAFFVARTVENGRLALAGGTLADPNEFALTLVVGLPFVWLKASAARGPKKLLLLLSTIPLYITFARTGSRSGLFAMLAVIVAVVLLSKGGKRFLILVGAVALLLVGSAFLPSYLRDRYLTIFTPTSSGGDAAQLASDVNSTEGRKQLLIESVTLTFQHPMFGVGPGVFGYAAADMRKAESGFSGLPQVSHNTYTQISSETGLPGFLFFALSLIFALKGALRCYRAGLRGNAELAKNARYLLISFAGVSVGIFFLSVGYTHAVALMLAYALSLENIAAALPANAEQTAQAERLGTPLRSANTRPAPAITKPVISDLPRRLRPTYLGSRAGNKQSNSSERMRS